jgi:hypothetical protein
MISTGRVGMCIASNFVARPQIDDAPVRLGRAVADMPGKEAVFGSRLERFPDALRLE